MSGWSRTGRSDSRPSTLTITLIGDPGGGKTSLKKQLVGKEFNNNEQITVGADFTFYKPENLDNTRLKICDIAGQASFETVRQNYLRNSDAALLVFDLTNPTSIENTENWIREYIRANKNNNTPILLVGNKSDLEEERKISLKTVKKFLRLAKKDYKLDNRVVGYIETSAKTGENVEKCFLDLSQAIPAKKIVS